MTFLIQKKEKKTIMPLIKELLREKLIKNIQQEASKLGS